MKTEADLPLAAREGFAMCRSFEPDWERLARMVARAIFAGHTKIRVFPRKGRPNVKNWCYICARHIYNKMDGATWLGGSDNEFTTKDGAAISVRWYHKEFEFANEDWYCIHEGHRI